MDGPLKSTAARNMFTTIVIDAFAAEGDPERYEKTYQVVNSGLFWL